MGRLRLFVSDAAGDPGTLRDTAGRILHPMEALPYHELPGFDGYYFEDGWVRGLYASTLQLVIEIDAVLTGHHPHFGEPNPGEIYCYERVAVLFPNARHVEWIQPLTLQPHRDPDGSVDYGNIDVFTRSGDVSHLRGEWGEVCVVSDLPVVGRLEGSH